MLYRLPGDICSNNQSRCCAKEAGEGLSIGRLAIVSVCRRLIPFSLRRAVTSCRVFSAFVSFAQVESGTIRSSPRVESSGNRFLCLFPGQVLYLKNRLRNGLNRLRVIVLFESADKTGDRGCFEEAAQWKSIDLKSLTEAQDNLRGLK